MHIGGFWLPSSEVCLVCYNVHCHLMYTITLSSSYLPEFSYENVFQLWETIWASRMANVTSNFEEFFALAIMKQFKYISPYKFSYPLPTVGLITVEQP